VVELQRPLQVMMLMLLMFQLMKKMNVRMMCIWCQMMMSSKKLVTTPIRRLVIALTVFEPEAAAEAAMSTNRVRGPGVHDFHTACRVRNYNYTDTGHAIEKEHSF
jgi:hypothetical protein